MNSTNCVDHADSDWSFMPGYHLKTMIIGLNVIEISCKRSRMEVFPVDTSSSERVHAAVLEVVSSVIDVVLSS